ncbi:hypothetical protein ACOMHN_007015 [Nucella lapillus]
MATPMLNRQAQTQCFRKRPPGQLSRDQERAKQHRQQQQQQRTSDHAEGSSHVNTCGENQLFALYTVCKQTSVQKLAEQHTTPACNTDTDGEEDHAASMLPAQDSGHRLWSVDCGVGVDQQQPVTDTVPTVESSIARFSAGVIKDYVSTLTDRSLQRRLRDRQRNKAFRKVVKHTSDGALSLLCESDYIVMEYSLDSGAEGECMFWCVKQKENNKLTDERVKLANLRKGKRLRQTEHRETEARAKYLFFNEIARKRDVVGVRTVACPDGRGRRRPSGAGLRCPEGRHLPDRSPLIG